MLFAERFKCIWGSTTQGRF